MQKPSLSIRICVLFCCLAFLLPHASAAGEEPTTEALGTLPYAVALYGIRHDDYLGGEEKAGLSFGPAMGGDYRQSYQAHVTEAEYLSDPEAKLCLHWMSWEEIAEQSLRDPEVFRPCLKAGCTHAVTLSQRRPLFAVAFPKVTGDGASCLFNSLSPGYLRWNDYYSITGGWPGCMIRATLNGSDAHTNRKLCGNNCLDQTNCLFSCFPEELQERIVPKAVVSELNYNSGSESHCVTTYDRLFLFSAYEIYGGIQNTRETEGPQYEKTALHPVVSGQLSRYYEHYSEEGRTRWVWVRSSAYGIDVINYHIVGAGHSIDGNCFTQFAVAPGFCLP